MISVERTFLGETNNMWSRIDTQIGELAGTRPGSVRGLSDAGIRTSAVIFTL